MNRGADFQTCVTTVSCRRVEATMKYAGQSLSENVASAILADVEPCFQPAEKSSAIINAFEIPGNGVMATILPGGRMPPSTAGREARRYIFRQAIGLFRAENMLEHELQQLTLTKKRPCNACSVRASCGCLESAGFSLCHWRPVPADFCGWKGHRIGCGAESG